MNERTRKILGTAGITSATIALVFGCVEPVRDIGFDSAPDAGANTVGFVPPADDASADGASALPEPDVMMCVSTECPPPFVTCPKLGGAPAYKCETNLLTDDSNCGACGNACPTTSTYPGLNIVGRCIDGKCALTCPVGFQDCNGLVDDGCESNSYTDLENCGACGNVCPTLSNGTRACTGGVCAEECLPPKVWCGTACVNPQSTLAHCGACFNACPAVQPPTGMTQVCRNGECGHFECFATRGDCNNDISDGCEIALNMDPDNCGACGTKCGPGQTCMLRADKGNVAMCSCDPHETRCGATSCADLLSDVAHCGACGNRCTATGAHTAANCQNGFCVTECAPGWGDCDGDLSNGCESNLSLNPRHCGACGNRCAPEQPCIDGVCAMVECDSDAGVVTK
ncbi:MAG: hypothetical protein KF894_16695 [Labilithrix sp.]|nr:hypothetical protein [Labilithrix sp.]